MIVLKPVGLLHNRFICWGDFISSLGEKNFSDRELRLMRKAFTKGYSYGYNYCDDHKKKIC